MDQAILTARIRQQAELSAEVKLASAHELGGAILAAVKLLTASLQQDGKILVCGNGGSAADAQHFAAELLVRYEKERPSLAAIALTTDTSTLTAAGNDYSFAEIFSRQVSGLGRAGDVLIAITTSGNSLNILNAIKVAHTKGMRVIFLSGAEGGKIKQFLQSADISLIVNCRITARIQETHLFILHCLCDLIDHTMFADL